MRLIFLRIAGEAARSDFSGAPSGGKGLESGAPIGEARADGGKEPQLGHLPGVLGEGGVDWGDGESLPLVEAFEIARECDFFDLRRVSDPFVNDKVK